MTIDKATLDKLLEGVDPNNPQSMFTDAGLFGQLKKALAERMLQAELSHHLEQQRNGLEPTRNHRNGSSKNSVLAAETKLTLDIPRDRDGSFEPQLIAKQQRRLPGFDDKVISLYARGLPVREIQEHLTELYGLEVSPDLISTITGEVMDEVTEWQNRPLEQMYPLVFFDALRVKIRDDGTVKIQTCIVHLIRNSLDFVGWKDRKLVAAELKTIYRATTEAEAVEALEAFADGPWGSKYPPIAAIWRRQWLEVIPFFAYPLEVRSIIYTTNAIESLNMQVRKVIKNRGHFPNDEATITLIWLALRNIAKDWKMPSITWRAAKTQFAILFAECFTAHLLRGPKIHKRLPPHKIPDTPPHPSPRAKGAPRG